MLLVVKMLQDFQPLSFQGPTCDQRISIDLHRKLESRMQKKFKLKKRL